MYYYISEEEIMKKFIWCSPHQPTNDQIVELEGMGELVFLRDLNAEMQAKIENTPDDAVGAEKLAWNFLEYLQENFHNFSVVQPAGNPMFQYLLGWINGIREEPVPVLYAYSVRECVEEKQADGSIKKTNIFKHKGFIEV